MPPTLVKLWLILPLSSASDGCSRSVDILGLTGFGAATEDTLMVLSLWVSIDLIDPAGLPVLPALPQSISVVEGDNLYDGAGEFDLDWATPPK